MEVSPLPQQPERPPLIFISYSHDSKDHKAWVAALANRLRDKGVEVLLDQFDVEPGDNIPQFMNDSVRNADRVLMICTDTYVRKGNDGKGGAGYEALIVTAELIQDLGKNKFISIIRQDGGRADVPICLGGRSYINLSDGPDSEPAFQQLLKTLHKVPLVEKSPLGLACLLAGITSENSTFANQLSWIDAILNQPEWPESGLTFWVELPELIFFTLQALVGGNLMLTDNIQTALKLATSAVKTRRDAQPNRFFCRRLSMVGHTAWATIARSVFDFLTRYSIVGLGCQNQLVPR
jgi:hypothetical protein